MTHQQLAVDSMKPLVKQRRPTERVVVACSHGGNFAGYQNDRVDAESRKRIHGVSRAVQDAGMVLSSAYAAELPDIPRCIWVIL